MSKMDSEQNRNERRDKKIERKKTGMRVNNSARKLAEILGILANKQEKK